jgi:hypothetical protein
VALAIELAVLPQHDADNATLELNASEGLSTDAGPAPLELSAVAAGQVYKRTVHVTADSDGMYYLGVVAILKQGEAQQSRAFSIPIIVGNPVAVAKASLPKDSKGQAIKAMRAVETVKP